MHLDAILTQRNSAEDRRTRRRALKMSVGLQTPTGRTSVVIHNIASGGLLLETESVALEVGDSITLELPEKGNVQAEVAWVNAPFFGCRIEESLSVAQIAAALLQSDPANGARLYEPALQIVGNPAVRIGPELNFSVAVGLSLTLWALIGLAVYLVY